MKRSCGRCLVLLLATLLAWLPMAASAHKESDAYLTLSTDAAKPDVLHGQFDIALRDLAFVLDIDSNHDSTVTWGEVKAHRGQIERFALAGVTVKGDGLTCQAHARVRAHQARHAGTG